MSLELYKLGAHHEAGHIVMAYVCGFTCELAGLILEQPGSGYSAINYGKFNLLYDGILEIQTNDTKYNALPTELKGYGKGFANKLCAILLAGPVVEAIHKANPSSTGDLDVDMRGPDLLNVMIINLYLSQIDQKHKINYVQDKLIEIHNLFDRPDVQTAVSHLANTILQSSNKSINQDEIENSLQQSGFLDAIK